MDLFSGPLFYLWLDLISGDPGRTLEGGGGGGQRIYPPSSYLFGGTLDCVPGWKTTTLFMTIFST